MMGMSDLPPGIRWAARLSHVREVMLRGEADPSFWESRLSKEGLVAQTEAGNAQVLLTAAEGSFRGIRFRELSVTVLAATKGQETQIEGAFLAGAFNSRRSFAWVERTLFSTPYAHGDVRLSLAPPRIDLQDHDSTLLFAEMSGAAREWSSQSAGGWEGVVFLPSRDPDRRKAFFARLRGVTDCCPFIGGVDRFELEARRAVETVQLLADSCFRPVEWNVRSDASHEKSVTRAMGDWRR